MDQEEIIDLCLLKLLQGILEILKWVIQSNYKVYTFILSPVCINIILEKKLSKSYQYTCTMNVVLSKLRI